MVELTQTEKAVMICYNVTESEWSATPTNVKQALLKCWEALQSAFNELDEFGAGYELEYNHDD